MPSICERYSRALLVSLDTDELAGLLSCYFGDLPWSNDQAVRRCLMRACEILPVGGLDHELYERLTAAWEHWSASRSAVDRLPGPPSLKSTASVPINHLQVANV